MGQVERDSIPANLLTRHYNVNAAQLITGPLGNAMFQEIVDSVVWYDERIKPIIFAEEVEPIQAEPAAGTPGYFLQRWSVTAVGSSENVVYQDIVTWDSGTGMWAVAANFDRNNDYVIFMKNGTTAELGANYIYDHRLEGNLKWKNIGRNLIIPHNNGLYVQGGSHDAMTGLSQYYHMTAGEHGMLPNLNNNLFNYEDFTVAGLIAHGSVAPSAPSSGTDYYLQTNVDGDINLYSVSAILPYGPVVINTTLYPYNLIVYCETNRHNYILDRVTAGNFFISQGVNNAVNHNEIQRLQGGNGIDEFFHMTATQYANITRTSSALYMTMLGVDSVLDVVASLSALNALSPVTDDYAIYNNSSASAGEVLYKYNGSAWVLQSAIDKRYEVYSEADGKVYYFNDTDNAFIDRGTNKNVSHSYLYDMLGRGEYHLDQLTHDGVKIFGADSSGYTHIGRQAGLNSTSGRNTFVGEFSGMNTTGVSNAFFGQHAGIENTSGDKNTYIGNSSFGNNETGEGNTAIGYHAGYLVGVSGGGISNTLIGREAASKISDGNSNVAIGVYALMNAGAALRNVAIGVNAGAVNADLEDCVFLGYKAGFYEDENHRLYISNNETVTPIIGGQFDNDRLSVNKNIDDLHSTFAIGGSFEKAITVTKTSAYPITEADYTIVTDSTAGDFDIILGDPTLVKGREVKIVNIGTVNKIIVRDTTGSSTLVVPAAAQTVDFGKGLTIQSNGVKWIGTGMF